MNWLVSIGTVVILILLTCFINFITNRKERSNRFKEEKYTKLLTLLQGFLISDYDSQTPSEVKDDMKREFLNEYYKSWLYASDDVIKTIKELLDRVKIENVQKEDSQKDKEILGKIILAVRSDLKVKTKLGYQHFEYVSAVKKRVNQ